MMCSPGYRHNDITAARELGTRCTVKNKNKEVSVGRVKCSTQMELSMN